MSDTKDTLKLSNVTVIDWYDGVISAVLDAGEAFTPHLCLALAWSPDYEVRVYGLIPLLRDTAERIRRAVREAPSDDVPWDEIDAWIAEVIAAHDGQVVVFAAESIGNDLLGQAKVHVNEAPRIRCASNRMERTHDEPELLRWLQRLEVPKPLTCAERDAEDD